MSDTSIASSEAITPIGLLRSSTGCLRTARGRGFDSRHVHQNAQAFCANRGASRRVVKCVWRRKRPRLWLVDIEHVDTPAAGFGWRHLESAGSTLHSTTRMNSSMAETFAIMPVT